MDKDIINTDADKYIIVSTNVTDRVIFHPISGFLPGVLHNLFEDIEPVELVLCIHEMIQQ